MEEDSFVILGTSPQSSLSGEFEYDTPGQKATSLKSCEQFTQTQTQTQTQSEPQPEAKPRNVPAELADPISHGVLVASSSSSDDTVKSVNLNKKPLENGENEANANANANAKEPTAVATSSLRSNGGGTQNSSLAASFILGEVNADVLKTSVYSQFPSLCSMEACAEDVVKLQNMMVEYNELKDTLAKVNLTMKRFYEKTQQWKDDMNRMEEQYKQQLSDCQTQIAALRNENLELKRNIEEKICEMKITDEMRQKEHAELVQGISEKNAQISNMSVQIEKLERQQLASYEILPRKLGDFADSSEYVTRLEHQRAVKEFERNMSVLLAENLELKDMQKQYCDEIDCLKVNLVSSEELLNQSRADIELLKSKDIEKAKIFETHESERTKMKEEIALLHQQVELYSKDFEVERASRQNLAGEKDQLLQDLRALQRKNQELIEETQKHWEALNAQSHRPITASASASSYKSSDPKRPIRALPRTSPTKETSSMHCCPICYKSCPSLVVLQDHVNICIDKASK